MRVEAIGSHHRRVMSACAARHDARAAVHENRRVENAAVRQRRRANVRTFLLRWSGAAIFSGAPPDADARNRPSTSCAKTIELFGPQLPPAKYASTGQIVTLGPPLASTCFNALNVANTMCCPSGEKTGFDPLLIPQWSRPRGDRIGA